MKDNKQLIEKLDKFKDFFDKKNNHIVYYDPKTGKLQVDDSKLQPEDKRNFKALTQKILQGTEALRKTENITAFDYKVILTSSFFTLFNVKEVETRLRGKAYVRSNLGNRNRDIAEITIEYYKR